MNSPGVRVQAYGAQRFITKKELAMIPKSVRIAITALVVMIALDMLRGILLALMGEKLAEVAIAVTLGLLIVWGMIGGHRLAWQWGRIVGILGAIWYTFGLGVAIFFGKPAELIPLWQRFLSIIVGTVLALCLYVIFFALGRPSARQYFRLRCPSCGKFTNQAADFFFNRAKCRTCGIIW
ncbi:MAG: hypothetical protein C4297_05225 [Gemmataceae bacterium]